MRKHRMMHCGPLDNTLVSGGTETLSLSRKQLHVLQFSLVHTTKNNDNTEQRTTAAPENSPFALDTAQSSWGLYKRETRTGSNLASWPFISN